MPGWMIFFIGLVALALEGVALAGLGVADFAVQVILAITIYLGLRRPFVVASWTLVALLLPTEWMVGGPLGLYSLGLVMVFLILRAVRSTVHSGAMISEALVGLVIGVLHGLFMAGALLITRPDSPLIPAILWQLPMAGLTLAITTPIVLRLAARVDERLRPSGGLRISA